jgi:hypothetical protein
MADQTHTHAKTFGSAVIVIGLVLAFAAAVVPQYGHYKLMAGVLVMGLSPYLAYGLIVVFLNSTVTMATGVVVLAVHAGLVYVERFGNTVDYSDGMIYVVPAIVTLALVPLVVMALRRPWHL